jgi:hypothetical protein
MAINDEHLPKQLLPIEVTESGIVIVSKEVHS